MDDNNNDDLKLDLSNIKIEMPKVDYSKPETTTTENKTDIKENNETKEPKETKKVAMSNLGQNLNNNGKANSKIKFIIIGAVILLLCVLVAFFVTQKLKTSHDEALEAIKGESLKIETTVGEPVTTTEVAPPVENTPVTTVPEPVNNTNVPQSIPETNNNVAPQQNTVNQVQNTQQYSAYDDYDLQVLEQVYDEVINRGNESYLYNFSSSELAIIRNTLYARRGYRFKKKKYQQYFGSKPWYKPTTDSQNILPKNEERLANIIKKYE